MKNIPLPLGGGDLELVFIFFGEENKSVVSPGNLKPDYPARGLVAISEQIVTFVLYNANVLVFITKMKSVYCAVRTGSINKAVCASSLKG